MQMCHQNLVQLHIVRKVHFLHLINYFCEICFVLNEISLKILIHR